MGHATLQDRVATIWASVRALNGWQRGTVAITAAAIAYYQFTQYADWDYEGDAWFIGFAVAGLLLFAALASRPPASGVNTWQRAALGVTAAAIAVLQVARLDAIGGSEGIGWVGAFLTAGALVVGVAARGKKPRSGDLSSYRGTPSGSAAVPLSPSPSIGSLEATSRPLPKKAYFRETDVERFIAACHALADEVVPVVLPAEMPKVPALAGYVEEVALAFSYGICGVVACVHNQQWPKSKGCGAVTERIVDDLTNAALKDMTTELSEEKARDAVRKVAAEYLKAAEIAAYGFCKLANDESHEMVRGLADAAKKGTVRDLRARAPRGTQVLAAWLANPKAGENHLAFVQAILGKAVGASFQGTEFRERLEALYGPLTRKMIERALLLLGTPLAENSPAVDVPSKPKSPTDADVEVLVARHRKLLADAHSSGDPRDFVQGLTFCPPDSAGQLNKGLWVCGCCFAPFKIDPEKVGLWFSSDHRGAPVALCAVCIEFLNYHHIGHAGGSDRIVLSAEYDGMGQAFAEKFRGQLPARIAVLRMAVIERREKASGDQQ